MPTKTKHNSPNTSKQHVSKSVLLLLGSTILSAGALFITSYISTLHYQQTLLKEDITFARIETFVDLAKLRLEQELPEGKWEIEKYCDLPNSKGTAATYSCSYGVVSSGMYQYV